MTKNRSMLTRTPTACRTPDGVTLARRHAVVVQAVADNPSTSMTGRRLADRVAEETGVARQDPDRAAYSTDPTYEQRWRGICAAGRRASLGLPAAAAE